MFNIAVVISQIANKFCITRQMQELRYFPYLAAILDAILYFLHLSLGKKVDFYFFDILVLH